MGIGLRLAAAAAATACVLPTAELAAIPAAHASARAAAPTRIVAAAGELVNAGAVLRPWLARIRPQDERGRSPARHGPDALRYFDGLPWPTAYSNYSTPRDLIIMGEAAMQNAAFRAIVGQRSHRIAATSQHHRYC